MMTTKSYKLCEALKTSFTIGLKRKAIRKMGFCDAVNQLNEVFEWRFIREYIASTRVAGVNYRA